MGQTLFEQWTGNRLRAAFAAAGHAERLTREAAFWRNVAYLARLTGGAPPTP